MTDELIRVLAEKLNIAVDGATFWLQDAIPQYCQMKVLASIVPCLFFFVAFCCSIVAVAHYLKKYRQLQTADKNKNYYFSSFQEDREIGNCFAACLAAFVTLFFFGMFLADALSWGFFPDAMVLSTIISKVA